MIVTVIGTQRIYVAIPICMAVHVEAHHHHGVNKFVFIGAPIMNYKFIIYSCSILIGVSCNFDDSSDKYVDYELVKKVRINVPQNFSDYSTCFKLDKYNPYKLYWETITESSIHVIDLDVEKYISEIKYTSTGPNALKTESRGFVQIHQDSFVFSGKGVNRLHYADLKGNWYRTRSYDYRHKFYFSSFGQDPYIIGDTWLLPTFPVLGHLPIEDRRKHLPTYDILTSFNIKKGFCEDIKIKYPGDLYRLNEEASSFPIFVYDVNSKKGCYTFKDFSGVYAIDLYTFQFDYKYLEAKHFSGNHLNANLPFMAKQALYPENVNLLVDTSRNLLYKIYTHNNIESYDASHSYFKDDIIYKRIWSIQVLDYDLNVLGDIVIDRTNQYVARNTFVGPDGLYLSRNNVYAEDYKEDVLTFDVIRFVE